MSLERYTHFGCVSRFPRPFILKLDQPQLYVDLECSHITIAKDWRAININTHTHTQSSKHDERLPLVPKAQ